MNNQTFASTLSAFSSNIRIVNLNSLQEGVNTLSLLVEELPYRSNLLAQRAIETQSEEFYRNHENVLSELLNDYHNLVSSNNDYIYHVEGLVSRYFLRIYNFSEFVNETFNPEN